MVSVLVCWQVQANNLWFCIRLWKIYIVIVLNLMVLNSNLLSVNFVLGFTEVLTVYFSVTPGERQDDRSCRIRGSREDTSRWKGYHHPVGESGVNKSGGVIRVKEFNSLGLFDRRFCNRYTDLHWDVIHLRPYIHFVNSPDKSWRVCSSSRLDCGPRDCVCPSVLELVSVNCP